MTSLVRHEDSWVLKLVGDVDTRAAKLIYFSEISEKLKALQATTLIIDLSEAEIVDSTGLGLLLEAKKELSRQNIEVVLSNPSAHMRRLFAIMQFDQLFSIHGNSIYADVS